MAHGDLREDSVRSALEQLAVVYSEVADSLLIHDLQFVGLDDVGCRLLTQCRGADHDGESYRKRQSCALVAP